MRPDLLMTVKNDQRVIFGWAMYDWANSAYATTVAALFPAFFAGVVVPEGGYRLWGRLYNSQTLWGYLVGLVAFGIFLVTPVLGAIADFSAAKRRFLRAFFSVGALLVTTLVFVGTGDVVLTMVLFIITQVGFIAGNVFYDGFLPDITTSETIDRVSARGFGLGYLGGGLHLALAFALITLHEQVGITQELAVRIGLATVGLWWLVFGIFALRRLPETGRAQPLPERYRGLVRPAAYARVGLERTLRTARRMIGFPHVLLFVAAFIIYNDGIATTIAMSSVYAADTLRLDAAAIALTFLIVQFVAFPGSLAFGWLAGRMGAKGAILVSLVIWVGIMVLAYRIPEGAATQLFLVAALVGLVLGGAQALSRSLYGSMIPEAASAEFFGFYSVFSKFSAIWGPLIFALVSDLTGSARNSILSLILFFVVGGILLARVNVEEARASRLRWDFEGAEVEVA